MSDNPAKLWHLAEADKTIGTFTSQQLADMGKAGQITSDMIVWRDGMGQMAARIEGEGARRQTVTVSPAIGSTAA